MLGLLSRNKAFFDDFEALAAHAVSSAQELLDLSAAWPEGKEHVAAIRDHEHHADEIAHSALQRLDRTFQTPIAQEHIHDLIQTLDSVIDTIKATADRFEVFHVENGNPAFIHQVQILLAAATSVEQAMRILRKNRRLPFVLDPIIAIHEQENQANDIQEAVMANLFGDSNDPLTVLKWKDLHELVLRATDQCEDVANIVERIAIQND
jgi:uncharacterized protein